MLHGNVLLRKGTNFQNQTKKIKNLAKFFSGLKSLLHFYLAYILVQENSVRGRKGSVEPN